MADEATEEQEEQSGGSRSKLLIFGAVGLVVLLGAGGAGYVFLAGADAPAEEGQTAESTGSEDGTSPEGGEATAAADFFSIEPFVVNIGDGDRDRFLKLKIDLEVSGAEVSAELGQRLPQIKDVMIGLLSSQSFADIRSLEGKDSLREELQTRLNAVVRKGTVRQVFFTEFVVQ